MIIQIRVSIIPYKIPISQATRTKMRSARGSAKQKEPVGKKVIGIMLWLRMRNEMCNDVMRKEGEMVVILMGLFKRQFINHIRFFVCYLYFLDLSHFVVLFSIRFIVYLLWTTPIRICYLRMSDIALRCIKISNQKIFTNDGCLRTNL